MVSRHLWPGGCCPRRRRSLALGGEAWHWRAALTSRLPQPVRPRAGQAVGCSSAAEEGFLSCGPVSSLSPAPCGHTQLRLFLADRRGDPSVCPRGCWCCTACAEAPAGRGFTSLGSPPPHLGDLSRSTLMCSGSFMFSGAALWVMSRDSGCLGGAGGRCCSLPALCPPVPALQVPSALQCTGLSPGCLPE